MFGRQVAKRDARSNGDAWRWINATHDGVHVVARRVQAVNRHALCIEHTRIAIGDQACGRTNVAGVEGHSIERAFAQSA